MISQQKNTNFFRPDSVRRPLMLSPVNYYYYYTFLALVYYTLAFVSFTLSLLIIYFLFKTILY
jgi:hypothetical protein